MTFEEIKAKISGKYQSWEKIESKLEGIYNSIKDCNNEQLVNKLISASWDSGKMMANNEMTNLREDYCTARENMISMMILEKMN